MNINECEKMLSSILPFWGNLSDSEKNNFCNNTMYVKYDKNANIHGTDDKCTGAIIIKSGILRVYIMSEDGRDITLYRLYPNDVCVLSASCIIESITFDVFVSAEEDTECIIINPTMLKTLAQQNEKVNNYILKTTSERFSDVMWTMQQILFMSFDKRLAAFLIDELAKTGGDTIKLTQEQIAKYIGSAREVVSRMLKYFASEKLVEVSRGGVRVINKSGLMKIIY